jgi:hypothetical protein
MHTYDKVKIEIPIANLISAFEGSPSNDESKVKRGKRKEFAEFIAENIVADCDSEDGSTPLTQAFDKVFDLILEGCEDNFINYGHEYDEYDAEPVDYEDDDE